ncbi:MAG: tetratricopeptide repeat protein [Cyclobacteriaceae bacterium]
MSLTVLVFLTTTIPLSDSTLVINRENFIRTVNNQQNDSAAYYASEWFQIARAVEDSLEICRSGFALGFIMAATGQYEKSVEPYEVALSFARSRGDTIRERTILNNLGVVYLNSEKYNEAIKYFQYSAAMRKPDDPFPYINMGVCYFNLQDFEKAYSNFKKASLLHEDAGLFINLAMVSVELGNHSEAQKYIENLERHYLEDAAPEIRCGYHFILGKIYIANHQINEAEMELTKSSEFAEKYQLKSWSKKVNEALKEIKR